MLLFKLLLLPNFIQYLRRARRSAVALLQSRKEKSGATFGGLMRECVASERNKSLLSGAVKGDLTK
jgi:hypothetical protein